MEYFPLRKTVKMRAYLMISKEKIKLEHFTFLRQQERKENETHYYSLVDFLEDDNQDKNFIGAFAS